METTMPDYRSMYDRDYIGHFDLVGGNDLTLTIKRVVGGELTAMGGRKSKKPIVHFKEDGIKPLICNKTNAKTIAAMYGNMVEEWASKRITLFVSMTRNPDGGGEVECIRVRPSIPRKESLPPASNTSAPPSDVRAGGVPKAAQASPSVAPADSSHEDAVGPAAAPANRAALTYALDMADSTIRAKFKGVMASKGWADVADIPADELPSALAFISREVDKANAREAEKVNPQ